MTSKASLIADTADHPSASLGEPDWEALRRDFPTTEKFVYLDSARKVIYPRHIESAFRAWVEDIYEHAGKRAFSMDCIEETRKVVAELFGVPANNIALIKNTSEGINIVAQGFPLRSGDNVIISDFEHENNTFPWRHLNPQGIEVRWAKPDAEGLVTTDCYRELVDDRTRMLSASWVTYGNGYRADVPALSEFCHERGIKLIIDGIQAVGILATPLIELGADVIVAGGHKGQFSLVGAGFMYATDEMIRMITPPYAAKFSFTSNDRMQENPVLAPDAHRFEYGNPNFLGIWIQRHSAEYLKNIGLQKIEGRIKELTTYLIDRADDMQLKVRTPRPWSARASIVSFDVGDGAGEIVEKLRDQNIIVSEKDGHLRAGLQFYNTKDELDRFLEAIQAASHSST